MDGPRIRAAARRIDEADDVLLHVGPEIVADTDIPSTDLARAIWGEPEGAFGIERAREAPELVWHDWLEFWDEQPVDPAAIDPRPVHHRIAELLEAEHVSTVVTETVFGLLPAAGVSEEDCIEFHGRVDRARCRSCGRTYDASPGRRTGHRRCPVCGETLTPGVVLAGEPPDRRDRLRAHARAGQCDLYVVAGTRLDVDPTAENAERALETGTDLIAIGDLPIAVDDAEIRIRDDSTGAIARLRDAVEIHG